MEVLCLPREHIKKNILSSNILVQPKVSCWLGGVDLAFYRHIGIEFD